VERARDDVFARPRLALQEHRRVRPRHAFDDGIDPSHLEARPHEIAERGAIAHRDERGLGPDLDTKSARAHAHHRPRHDVDVAHAKPFDERSVRAPSVPQRERAGPHAKLAVEARDLGIFQDQGVGLSRSDGGRPSAHLSSLPTRKPLDDQELDGGDRHATPIAGDFRGPVFDELGAHGGALA
jgi:hypothetical protein